MMTKAEGIFYAMLVVMVMGFVAGLWVGGFIGFTASTRPYVQPSHVYSDHYFDGGVQNCEFDYHPKSL